MHPFERLLLLTSVLATATLLIPTTEARGFSSRFVTRKRAPSYSQSPPAELDSDSELLRALEFLEKYERMKGTVGGRDDDRTRPLPPLYQGPISSSRYTDVEPYAMQRGNHIQTSLDLNKGNRVPYMPMPWDVDVEVVPEMDDPGELALEDLIPPRPQDLETNEAVFAEAVAEEFRNDEDERQRALFQKILGDVMAEKLLQQDEEENIEELMEAEKEEERGLEDLAAILDSEGSMSSSVPASRLGPYGPEQMEESMFSASSQPAGDEIFTGESSSSDAVDQPGDDDSYALSEAGLEALDEAEEILKEGYQESEESDASESSESMPDFDDASDVAGLFQGPGKLESSGSEEPSEETKENVLKDVIYRIVEDNLRRKIEASVDNREQYSEETSMASSIPEEVASDNDRRPVKTEDDLLDSLVDEIRDQVDELSSKIMRQIEGKDTADKYEDESSSDSDESQEQSVADDAAGASSSVGVFDGPPHIAEESSSLPGDIGNGIELDSSSSLAENEFDGELSSSSGGEELAEQNEELLNAIREILPATEPKVCPVLSYLVDDCSVIEGFKGLGSGGYREAFSRPCNRHQLCYICSNSYNIPPNLCDEIYKAELLTLCNGDPECKQRAKYFWIAATNDRRPPHLPLSFCSDRCLLEYLLED